MIDLEQFFKGNIITMLIGNKVDNESERQVEKKKGLELALQKNFAFYEVSAKTGFNTDLIFKRMAECK